MTQGSEIEQILRDWGGRPSVAVIDLDQLRVNIGVLRGMIGDGVRLMAVVKADGYGHGSIPVAKAAVRSGVEELAVATVEEGVRLRASGVRVPILVMGPIGERERRRAISHDLMLVIGSKDFALALSADVRASGRTKPLDVHLKVDSGMHRFGVEPARAVEVARAIDEASELRLAGVMTHLASADDPDPEYTHEQTIVFDGVVDAVRRAGIDVPTEHLANSAATMRFPGLHRDRVRVGIAMYGLQPDASMPLPEPMRPIMTVHSRLARVVSLEAGDRVSYGGTWVADDSTRVGLVPIGYADGYRRQGSNLAWMDVAGERAPVRGRICMDQTLVEVGPEAKPGDQVTVIGNGTTGVAPTIDRLADLYGTISHELPTNLVVQRLAHLYVQGGSLVAVSDLWGYRELDQAALVQPAIEAERPAQTG